MTKSREIRDSIQKISGTFLSDKVHVLVCTVDSVDEDARTCMCTAVSGEADTKIESVQLMAEENDGFLIIPEIDSTVIVVFSDRNIPFVAMFSAVKTIYAVAEKFQFNDGAYGGLIKIEELITKINSVENLVNNILNTLKTTTIPLAPSGSYPFAPLYAAIMAITPVTQKSDLENTKVIHG